MATKKGKESLIYIGAGTEPPHAAAITALTDNSGGTADNTLQAIGATYSQTEVRNNFADLAAKINQILTLLQDVGLRK